MPKKALVVLGEWRDDALCRGKPTNLFYPERSHAIAARAKKVCSSCPVSAECLEESLVNGEMFGIWGGLDTQERKELLKLRRRAANEALDE